MVEILYSDEHILVCVKPVGVKSQGDDGNSMPGLLKAQENAEYIAAVHRLDQAVGGVMVYAKSEKAAAELSKAVADHTRFVKEYLAVVQGCPETEAGVFEDLLFKDSGKNKSFVVKRMRRGVKKAALEFRRLDTRETDGRVQSLVRVKLHTGRTHQIRVQFASRKMPLVGDGKYGSRDNRCTVALWSHVLAFRHPITGQSMEFSCMPPCGYPWELFQIL